MGGLPPQLQFDFSVFMYKFPYIHPFIWTHEDTSFVRFNYNWEDDIAFYDVNFDWSEPYFPGLVNIYDFHPIHIDLNSCSYSNYNILKSNLSGRPLSSLAPFEIDSHRNVGLGARTFLNSLIQSDGTHLNFEELICEWD